MSRSHSHQPRNELFTTMTLTPKSLWPSLLLTTLIWVGCSSGENDRGEPQPTRKTAGSKTLARAPVQHARVIKANVVDGGAPVAAEPHAAMQAHGMKRSPHGTSGAPHGMAGSPHGMAPGMGASAGPAGRAATVGGLITIAPSLASQVKAGAIMFIVARPDDGTDKRNPAVAVRRITVTGSDAFPFRYELGAGDSMMAGGALSGRLRIEARLDGDGDALSRQPGDLQGRTPKPVAVGEQHADLVLDSKI